MDIRGELMTENYLKAPMLSCIYLWKQFSAVNPYKQIPVPVCIRQVVGLILRISLPIKKAREEMNTRRVPFCFRPDVILLVWVPFSLFKIKELSDDERRRLLC